MTSLELHGHEQAGAVGFKVLSHFSHPDVSLAGMLEVVTGRNTLQCTPCGASIDISGNRSHETVSIVWLT